jgi:hypothetical protein
MEQEYPGAAGLGNGRYNSNKGTVTFNPSHWWTENKWGGFGLVTQPDGTYTGGNGWLIVHETLHALGMGHVNDRSEVMNPFVEAYTFGSGDLDGLHTMYLNQPCAA